MRIIKRVVIDHENKPISRFDFGGYYVYTLTVEGEQKPFYVGKGTGDRAVSHLKPTYLGMPCPKNNKIRTAHACGKGIVVQLVFRTHCEQEAFDHETELVGRLGLSNLTNMKGGGAGGSNHKQELKAKLRAAALRQYRAEAACA